MTSLTKGLFRCLQSRMLNKSANVAIVPLFSGWSRCLLTPPAINKEKTVEVVIRDLKHVVIGGPTTYDEKQFVSEREKLIGILPSSQDELPAR